MTVKWLGQEGDARRHGHGGVDVGEDHRPRRARLPDQREEDEEREGGADDAERDEGTQRAAGRHPVRPGHDGYTAARRARPG